LKARGNRFCNRARLLAYSFRASHCAIALKRRKIRAIGSLYSAHDRIKPLSGKGSPQKAR
jgi:hypothetical protein